MVIVAIVAMVCAIVGLTLVTYGLSNGKHSQRKETCLAIGVGLIAMGSAFITLVTGK